MVATQSRSCGRRGPPAERAGPAHRLQHGTADQRTARPRSTGCPTVVPSSGEPAVVTGATARGRATRRAHSAAICAQRHVDALPDLDLAGARRASAAPPVASTSSASQSPMRGAPRGWPRGRASAPSQLMRSAPPRLRGTAAPRRGTAATMRCCMPQRHRWRSSASRTCCAVGSGMQFEQRRRAHQDAARAVAALDGLHVGKRALQRMRCFGVPRPSTVRDRPALDRPHRRVAGRRPARPSTRHEAGAARARPAAEARAAGVEPIAQHVEQARSGSTSIGPRAVQLEGDRHRATRSIVTRP